MQKYARTAGTCVYKAVYEQELFATFLYIFHHLKVFFLYKLSKRAACVLKLLILEGVDLKAPDINAASCRVALVNLYKS